MWTIKYILPSINALASLITIIILLKRNKKTAIERSYIFMSAIWLNWSIGTIFTMLWGTGPIGEYLYWIRNISAFSMGPVWLVFSLYYTNNKIIYRKLGFSKYFFIIVPAFIMYIVSITNYYHGIFFVYDNTKLIVTSYNWGFWVHMIIQYFYILNGLWLILRHAIKNQGYVKKRSFLIFIGLFLTQFFIILYYLLGLYKRYDDFDIAPSMSLIALLFILIASVKYKFLNILPMALPKIVENLREGIMIVDMEGKIASYNSAFCSMFEKYTEITIGSEAKAFSEVLLNKGIYDGDGLKVIKAIYKGGYQQIKGEIRLSGGLEIQINYQPLIENNYLMGGVISFYDIGEQKALMGRLQERNQQLLAANDRLIKHAEVVEELVAVRERNKFACEIHDSVGHSLAILGALLEVSKLTYYQDPATSLEKIENALDISKSTLSTIRHSVTNISHSINESTLLESIKNMIYGFEATGINVDFTVHGDVGYSISQEIAGVVFNLCRESLTNSLKHGEAKTVNIILKINIENIEVFVFDDGKGCDNLKIGTGLRGMKKRVNELGGSISFGSGGENGFSIHVQIPLSD